MIRAGSNPNVIKIRRLRNGHFTEDRLATAQVFLKTFLDNAQNALSVWGGKMTLFVPNCLRKRACATGVSYSGYTITDYLALCEVPIFAASSKLAPQKKTGYAELQHILFFSVELKQPSCGVWNHRKVKIN